MSNQYNDFLGNLFKAAMSAGLVETQKLSTRTIMNERRRFLECHPGIETSVTDEDMLLLHVDMALDAGDEESFVRLTEELKLFALMVPVGG